MTASPTVRTATAIADPDNPTHVLRPTADGAIALSGDLTVDPTNLNLEATQLLVKTAIDLSNTRLTSLNTVIGTVADAAWSGSGNGTVISLLKAIAINTTPP